VTVLRASCLLLLSVTLACGARPEKYPSREIKLIVQAAPGGISDAVSRVAASLVEKRLGVPVVCENRPGAAGALAFSYVARRSADGYTIGHAPVEIAMVRTLGYAEVGPENMDLICLVTKTKPVLVVRSEAPWHNFREFLEAAEHDFGRLILANSGTGSIWHFNALLMEREGGVRFTHVPFNGSSAALGALLGGHVDAVVAGVGEVISHVESGRLRALLVLDSERSGLLPDTPNTVELHYDFGAGAWSGFFAPKGLPDEVRTVLEQAFREASETEEFRKLCRERGMESVFLGSADFRAFALAQGRFFAVEIPRLIEVRQ
jgi:tripartite-type tricarboxylate transporter receptor subunit TctC